MTTFLSKKSLSSRLRGPDGNLFLVVVVVCRQVEFGSCSCSHYLLATGTECLHVWDMLTCRCKCYMPKLVILIIFVLSVIF